MPPGCNESLSWLSTFAICFIRWDKALPQQKIHYFARSVMVLLIHCRRICFIFFFFFFFFRGPGQDNTEPVDISYYQHYWFNKDLLHAFKQSGFTSSSIEDQYKLLPCSLGTFVKASSKDPKCLECPAGNFSLIYDMRVTHFNRKDKHT